MTTQEIITDIGAKAESIRQQSDLAENGPARDLAIQIITLSGRLQAMNSTLVSSLHKIAADKTASGVELQMLAKAALSNINEY